jgi:hypothetical protein
MQRVESMITTMPYRSEVVQAAFGYFCETGLLPEEHRLADAVCRRALGGDYLNAPVSNVATSHLEALICATGSPQKPRTPPSVRECVFDEAVYGEGIVR